VLCHCPGAGSIGCADEWNVDTRQAFIDKQYLPAFREVQ
jgi:hypothetical protein